MAIVEYNSGPLTAAKLMKKYSKYELAREYLLLLDDIARLQKLLEESRAKEGFPYHVEKKHDS